MTTQLAFHNTQFKVVDRNGQPWLRLFQIGSALGYSKPDLVGRIYQKHADEFTDGMTAIVKLPDLILQNGGAGQMREIRIFSLRGAHLLAMLSRTKLAKEFRRWVLDILDREVGIGYERSPLTPAQQRTLQEAVSARTAGLTDQQKHLAFPRIWGGVKTTFRVPSYKELDSRQFDDALSYINHYPLEGELLLKETAALPETRAKLNISYPISCWANGAANMPKIDQSGMVAVLVDNIIGGDYYSPIHHLLRQLEQEGYDISACKLEIMSLRSHLENLHNILRDIEHRAGYNRHFRIKD